MSVTALALPRGNGPEEPLTVTLDELATPYTRFRVRDPLQEERVLRSMTREGQRHPVLVARHEVARALLDGHKRLRAARTLELPGLEARIVDVDPVGALLQIAKAHDTVRISAVEEGLLLREIHDEHHLSVRELARRWERNESYVQRRIALVRDFPEDVLDLVRAGQLLPSVVRALFPIARQEPEGAARLARACAHARLGARDGAALAIAYVEMGPCPMREVLVREPRRYLLRLRLRDPRMTPREAAVHNRIGALHADARALAAALRSAGLLPVGEPARSRLHEAWTRTRPVLTAVMDAGDEVLGS